jgi:homoserine kinase
MRTPLLLGSDWPEMARAAFRGGAVHVRVPATSANLGPGFDALGLALGLHDDVVAVVGEDGVLIDVAGEGADDVPRDEQHLIVVAMRATFEVLGGQPRGIELSCANRIPHGRGLGSSAAAIVAGVLLARALVLGGDQALPDADVLALASRLEGHPDNVAACLFGGLTIAWTDADDVAGAVRLDLDPAITPVIFIPPTSGSTELARRALPAHVPHADAAFNSARAALLVSILTGAARDLDDDRAGGAQLLIATEDRLHQGYRREGAPDTANLMVSLRSKAIAAVVSGAGPSVLALARDAVEVDAALDQTPAGWQGLAVPVDPEGARIVPIPR